MRALLFAAALAGLAFLPAGTPAAAAPADAKVVKTPVCHYAADEDQYVYIEVPAKQMAKGVGHARHTADILGLTREACVALNAPA